VRHGAYRAALRRPIDENLAVYCSYWGRGYSCNPAAIHAAARRLAPHIRSVFLVTEEAAGRMPDDVEYAVIDTPRYWELLARAKYLVNNANFANAVVKRPGTVHLQTQHGTPLKKMGIEQAEYPVVAAHSGSFGKLLARVDRWDYNLSSNRHSTEVWEREFPADYEMLEYGYPRNDVYQGATAADVARIRRELGVPEDRTAILYAPTHRDYRTAFRAQLDLDAFLAAAGEEFVVLLRAHYFYEEDAHAATADSAGGGRRIIDVTGHPSAEELCLAADALVTDYSSIMFDYANLDRPIVVYADDWDVYRETRGVTFDITAFPPGPVARTEAELARIFRDGSWGDAHAARLRERFRERFCTFDDGRAAERVVRRVLLGEPPEAIPPVVPLAARTPAPAARPAAPYRTESSRAESSRAEPSHTEPTSLAAAPAPVATDRPAAAGGPPAAEHPVAPRTAPPPPHPEKG
jgi:CDP-glycerol glycerophosphotransferase (TagB/SpsB family)